MALKFGATNADDVASLIAKKNYSKAIEVIKAQLKAGLKAGRPDARLRMQLGDVLILAGRDQDAIAVLLPVADEYAREGFAAKAVAVLKKIQKLDPRRREIEMRLAELIQQKQNQASVSLPLTAPPPPAGGGMPEIGLEEIGFEGLPGGAISVPAPELDAGPALENAPPPARQAPPPPVLAPEPPPLRPEPAPKPKAKPPAPPVPPAAVPDLALPDLALPDLAQPSEGPIFDFGLDSPKTGASELLDQDLFTEDPDLFLLEEDEKAAPVVAVPAPAEEADPMTDGLFAKELLSLVEDAFQGLPSEADGSLAPPSDSLGAAAPGSQQIVISPLFKDFSVDEMVAVIQGLKLVTFDTRQVILREGAPAGSMYMLTAGTAKAYVKNAQGKQALVGELNEGAFFGEISMLSGKPRTATVVAATHCEALELDRAAFDGITAQHPHVREVMEQFARERLARRG